MSEKGSVDDVSGLLKRGAIKLMQKIDPYLVAVYHFREEAPDSGYPETKAAIDHCFVYAPRKELPWVYALLGDVLRREGRYEDAVVKFRQALLLNPSFPRPMMRWGNALADQGRHEEAIGRYKKTLEIAPIYPEALVYWADSLEALGQHEEAHKKYQEALAMDPEFPRIVFAYGKYLAHKGEKARAAEYLHQAVELDGGRNKSYVAALRKVQGEIDPILAEIEQVGAGKK
jgi:tetratricopeptide (TPR) repeat protein